MNGVYPTARLKLQIVQLLMLFCRKRKSKTAKAKLQWEYRTYSKQNEHVKFNTDKDETNKLHIDRLGINKLEWTEVGHSESKDHIVH